MIYTAHALKRARGSHYFELFKKLNVTAVVRLNEEKYNAQVPALSLSASTRRTTTPRCVHKCARARAPASECMRPCVSVSVCTAQSVPVYVSLFVYARAFLYARVVLDARACAGAQAERHTHAHT